LLKTLFSIFNPEKIILFGSYAYGTPNENSDIDLLIIMPFEGKSSRKSLEIWSKIKPAFSCDLIVKTPEDISKRYSLGDPLVGEAVDKGRVLYERFN
jgi:predicted nucleotidyltransferase